MAEVKGVDLDVLKDEIGEISKQVIGQDNLATSNPIFIVQQKRRIGGMDPQYTDDFYWVDFGGEVVDEEELKYIEEILEKAGPYAEPEVPNYYKVYCTEIWEFVTACFTRHGCEEYIKANGHNLNEPRIYVDTGYRNREWEVMREFFKNYERFVGSIKGGY